MGTRDCACAGIVKGLPLFKREEFKAAAVAMLAEDGEGGDGWCCDSRHIWSNGDRIPHPKADRVDMLRGLGAGNLPPDRMHPPCPALHAAAAAKKSEAVVGLIAWEENGMAVPCGRPDKGPGKVIPTPGYIPREDWEAVPIAYG